MTLEDSVSSSVTSITQIKHGRTRSKLAIRHISPAFTEEEFRELVGPEWLSRLDYFSFQQGTVARDPFGRILTDTNPTYGCVHVNLQKLSDCAAFYRTFNGQLLVDSLGLKARLIVDFALNQKYVANEPRNTVPQPDADSWKASSFYQEFIASLPQSGVTSSMSLVAPMAQSESGTCIAVDSSQVLDLSVFSAPKFAQVFHGTEGSRQTTLVTPLVEFLTRSMAAAKVQSRKGPKPGKGKKQKEKERRAKGEGKTEARKWDNDSGNDANRSRSKNKPNPKGSSEKSGKKPQAPRRGKQTTERPDPQAHPKPELSMQSSGDQAPPPSGSAPVHKIVIKRRQETEMPAGPLPVPKEPVLVKESKTTASENKKKPPLVPKPPKRQGQSIKEQLNAQPAPEKQTVPPPASKPKKIVYSSKVATEKALKSVSGSEVDPPKPIKQ